MQFSYDYFFQTSRKVFDKYRRGEHKGIRFITFIDKDNIDAVKIDELWDKGIDAIERIRDIEEGRETNDELADAKQYLNLVLEEVSSMQNKAAKK